ncbi:LysR family transcriptional regulator [Paraburkholderia elongata]|uniref:LysR family transcriptional regulator n=1 Tax=Paraburkholderia elongata TaxID=2675747 RepID=A0A972P0K1_9BURK|nr:LysR family transcriptional regulator [Paraburkholderia elongata]NPT62626.1 LysR family transcriptional regulator [Paraburkholderia elongata]
MDKLQTMRTFVRVVEAGSFSAVARESDTTQSAVSKQVAALERELGARLLTRTTRSLALTEDGERYFEQVRRLVTEIAEAESTLQRGEQQLTGWLRVAASVGFGRLKLMPTIQSFLAAHGGVKIDLRLHDGFIDLVEQGIDVAVRIGDLPDSGLIARRVGTTYRMLVAHRSYLRSLTKGTRAPTIPEDLSQHNCIVYTEQPMRNHWNFTAGPGTSEPAGTTRIVRVEGNLQTNSSEVMRASVLAGMGIGYSPTWLFDQELASGEVQQLLPDWTPPAIPVHVVSPRERRHSAKVKAFVEYVSQEMASE